jgi:hypothetical protein
MFTGTERSYFNKQEINRSLEFELIYVNTSISEIQRTLKSRESNNQTAKPKLFVSGCIMVVACRVHYEKHIYEYIMTFASSSALWWARTVVCLFSLPRSLSYRTHWQWMINIVQLSLKHTGFVNPIHRQICNPSLWNGSISSHRKALPNFRALSTLINPECDWKKNHHLDLISILNMRSASVPRFMPMEGLQQVGGMVLQSGQSKCVWPYMALRASPLDKSPSWLELCSLSCPRTP